MHQPSRLMLLATAIALVAPSAALAQSSPMPASSSGPVAPMPMSTGSGTMTSSPMPAPSPRDTAPAGTSAPAPSATGAPSSGGSTATGAPRSTQPVMRSTAIPDGAKIKQIKTGTLTRSQTLYGVTHPIQEANMLLKMKTVNFDNLRLYKLPASLQGVMKVSDAETERIVVALLGEGVQYAQTSPPMPSANGNNSPIQYLHNVLANINVSNALNNLNVLNNSNVNLNVALSNVLNNNKISIGQVVGLYIGGGGIITTITK